MMDNDKCFFKKINLFYMENCSGNILYSDSGNRMENLSNEVALLEYSSYKYKYICKNVSRIYKIFVNSPSSFAYNIIYII